MEGLKKNLETMKTEIEAVAARITNAKKEVSDPRAYLGPYLVGPWYWHDQKLVSIQHWTSLSRCTFLRKNQNCINFWE